MISLFHPVDVNAVFLNQRNNKELSHFRQHFTSPGFSIKIGTAQFYSKTSSGGAG